MASYNLSSFAGAGAQFFDDNGSPLTGGKVYTYAAGTTTSLATYTTTTGAVANANPIILDAAGRTPNEIWLAVGTLYKFIVKTSADVLVGTYDGLPAINDPYSINALLGSITGTNAIAASATPAITAYAAGATYSFIAANSNTAATTISINGLAAKSITKNGSVALTAGDIQAGKLTWIEYDGTSFQLLNNIVYGGSIANGTIVSLSAPLSVANGGTGLATISANSVILGNGVSAVQTVAPGTAKNVLTSNGTTWASTAPVIVTPTAVGQVPFSTDGSTYTATAKIAAATAITASGSSLDFTSIPSWVKRITVMFNGLSLTGTDDLLVRIGAGSLATSGYISTSILVNNTSGTNGSGVTNGFTLRVGIASNTNSGHMTITNVSGNIWVSSHCIKGSTVAVSFGGGDITLSGTLDRLSVVPSGSNTFDAGSINIFYE